MNLFVLWESVNSVALSHEENCECRICRAANGDENAWIELVIETYEEGK